MKVSKKKQFEGGFFARLFGKEGAKQKRIIRLLKRELNAQKIDLYRIKNDTISPPIAKLVYEIYRLSYPLRQHLPLDRSRKRFLPSFEERFIIAFHSDEALKLYEKLTQDYIQKLAVKHGIKKTEAYVNKLLDEYLDLFDSERIIRINSVYTNLLGFARFVHFDFYPFLREFDMKLEEKNFLRKPSFSSAEGTLLRNDLVKMHRALFRFDVDEKLDTGMDIIKRIHNTEPISKAGYSKLKNLILSLQKKNYLSLIIRAIDRSLTPVSKEPRVQVNIFHEYSQKRKAEVTKITDKLKSQLREEAVSSIAQKLFEGSVAGRIKNYQEVINEPFRSLNLPLYGWIVPLNYMKAFITDKYKPSVDRVVNELIVGGIFINKGILNELSNSYYALHSSLEVIEGFDDALDVDGDRGRIIKRLMENIEKEKGARKALVNLIDEINKQAKLIIDENVVNLRDMAYSLRNILEDYKKKTPSIVSNLKKIRTGSNRQFIEELLQGYKDIYLFLKLISNYVSIKISREEVENRKSLSIKKIT